MLQKVLNHMCCPHMRYDEFMHLAKAIGCIGVHYRNDLNGELFSGDTLANVKALAHESAMQITGLAQLERFNDWNAAREEQAVALLQQAKAIGAAGIGLIPTNDGTGTADGQRQLNLEAALWALKPLLIASGLKGFIEPLGFAQCSLRHKSEAVEAIEKVDGKGLFYLVHDTFHHFLANEVATGAPIFADYTAIVELSGVVDPDLNPSEMQDKHRVLVDGMDRIGNVDQLRDLIAAGFKGPLSFEPFSPEVHSLENPGEAFTRSFDFIALKLRT